LLFQVADKAIATDDGVVVVVSAFRSRRLLSLSAPLSVSVEGGFVVSPPSISIEGGFVVSPPL
jgi:hypothetical protein